MADEYFMSVSLVPTQDVEPNLTPESFEVRLVYVDLRAREFNN